MNTILTADERRAAADAAGPFTADQHRAIEVAVLAKLAQQVPARAMHLGWDTLDNGTIVATYALPVKNRMAPKLYAHPAPPQADRQRVPDWKPIHTAPTDGTAILVSEGRFIHCVEWNEEFEWWAVDDNKLGPFRLRGSAPTHWMPLPAAPGAAPGAAPEAPALKYVPLTDARIIEVLGDTKHSQITAVRALIAESHAAPEAPAQASACPQEGEWIAAGDYRRNVRALDVALNGDGAAERPSLIDVLSQVEQLRRELGKPVLQALADRQRVPEGYVLVPVEATPAMLKELGNSWDGVNRAIWQRVIAAAPEAPAQAEQHPDDAAVDDFAQAMKYKLASARHKGREGWQTCPPEELSRMLREHVEKGDPLDVANFCMFLWCLGHGIAAANAWLAQKGD